MAQSDRGLMGFNKEGLASGFCATVTNYSTAEKMALFFKKYHEAVYLHNLSFDS